MKIEVPEFFKEDYVNQASYDNLRKIASCVDGLKNSNRKVIHTVLDKNIKELIKVQQLGSKAAEYTDYLHGSLDGVIVTLGQCYTGSNQLPLLHKKGNFGTRAIPDASASRYIFASASPLIREIFAAQDRAILEHQVFEGEDIEPRFFVPTLPMLFVNGNRGVSSGFSQYIAPRSLNSIILILAKRLAGSIKTFESFNQELIFYAGFKGNVYRDQTEPRWVLDGTFVRSGKTLLITELPLDAKLRNFVEMLETLKEAKKIKNFNDECDGDNFQFKVTFSSAAELSKLTDEEIIKMFKLRGYITENFTCVGADNKIHEFTKPSEVLEYYYQIKLEYLAKRKDLLLKNLDVDIKILENQKRFILAILNREIDLRGLDSSQLAEYLEQNRYYKDPDKQFTYLTSMPISRATKDNVDKLAKMLADKTNEFEALKIKTIEALWKEDLKLFKQQASKLKINFN